MPPPLATLGFVAPMLPTLVGEAPEGGEWVHETKFDGYRTLITTRATEVNAYTRNGHDWTWKYGPVVASAHTLRRRSAILDGDLCVQDEAGVTDFGALRRSIRSAPERLVLFAFDLLALDGKDLRGAPLRDRRRRLQGLVGADPCPASSSARSTSATGAPSSRQPTSMG